MCSGPERRYDFRILLLVVVGVPLTAYLALVLTYAILAFIVNL